MIAPFLYVVITSVSPKDHKVSPRGLRHRLTRVSSVDAPGDRSLLSKIQWNDRTVSLFHTQTDRTRKAFLRNRDFGPELFTFLTPRRIGNVLRNEERYGFSEHR